MGNSSEYRFGPVNSYSIKTNMYPLIGRGFTWGMAGRTPVASIEAMTGNMQIQGNFISLGNIGIGTTNPASRLHVNGDAYLSGTLRMPGSTNILLGSDVIGGGEGLRLHYNDGLKMVFMDYNKDLYFRTNSTSSSPLKLQSNGNVVIGMDVVYNANHDQSSNYRLAVNGGVLCEELKVVLDVPQADFVFEDDYELMTFSELESFIQENKHLPNIPSAKEFEEDGYKVGEMDEMLLRKVEELTLYIIQLKKEIEILKNGDSKK